MATEKQQTMPEAQGPAGFNQADTDVDDHPPWDFDTDPLLEGTVIKVKVVPLMRRAEMVDVRMAVVRTKKDNELRCLWESANLKNFFDVLQADHEIYVQKTGEQQLSGNRTMALFDAYWK
jgi:hypothetical protein